MIDTVMTSQALPAEVRQVLLRIARLQFVMAPEARNRGKLPQLAWVAIHTPERAADGHGRVGPQREPGAIVRVVRDLSQGEGGLGSPMLRVAIAAIPRFGETGVEAGDDRQLGGHLLMAGQAAVTHPIAIPEGGVTLVALVTEIGMGADPADLGLPGCGVEVTGAKHGIAAGSTHHRDDDCGQDAGEQAGAAQAPQGSSHDGDRLIWGHSSQKCRVIQRPCGVNKGGDKERHPQRDVHAVP